MHIAASFLAFIVTFVITTLCVAWAYFAAPICARIARRRGLNIKRPALHAAIYSAILFLPWRHLTRQMRGDPITRENIRDAYYYAYALAALVVASHIALIFTITYPSYSLDSFMEPFVVKYIFASTAGVMAFAAGLYSLFRVKKRMNELQERRESPNALDLPNRSYIAPFAWAWAAMLISSAPLWNFWFIIVDWLING